MALVVRDKSTLKKISSPGEGGGGPPSGSTHVVITYFVYSAVCSNIVIKGLHCTEFT